jgi:hypothetical protein
MRRPNKIDGSGACIRLRSNNRETILFRNKPIIVPRGTKIFFDSGQGPSQGPTRRRAGLKSQLRRSRGLIDNQINARAGTIPGRIAIHWSWRKSRRRVDQVAPNPAFPTAAISMAQLAAGGHFLLLPPANFRDLKQILRHLHTDLVFGQESQAISLKYFDCVRHISVGVGDGIVICRHFHPLRRSMHRANGIEEARRE